ncbi:hypothetical protein N8482_01755 [Chitinophagales bacterium]|nr:hypothetical protein [Chitinophagales bacterium]
MKLLFGLLAFFLSLFISLEAKAHNPDVSSTLLVEQTEGKWLLQIRAALTAFEFQVEEHYGENSYTSPEEFEQLVIDHVRKNISILFNQSDPIELQHGLVKLGHETSVTFEVKGVPTSFELLTLKNSSFSDITRNQGTLIILKEGFEKSKFTLNNTNDHTVNLKVDNSTLREIAKAQGNNLSIYLLISVSLLLLLFVYFRFSS